MGKMKRIILNSLLLVTLMFSITSISYVAPTKVFAATSTTSKPKLTSTKKTLYKGYKSYSLSFNNLSKAAKVSYKSSNSKIAKVDSTGKVTPLAKGTATITATVKQNNETYSLKAYITVKDPYIKLTATTKELKINETFTFKANTYGISDKITWSVSDEKLASIDSSTGKVKAKAGGEVTVTAKAGKYKKTYKLTIGKLTAEGIYKKCSPSTVEIIAKYDNEYLNSQGSGFFIDKGVVVTNYHVIEGSTNIVITTSNNKKYKVNKILGYDKELDIAILSIPTNNTSLVINKKGAKVGEVIYALGSPFGLTGTLTEGIVSSASRILDGANFMQISASISQGNSGGPLINAYGEVIGINTLTYYDGQNINFSLNIAQLDKVDTSKPLTMTEYAEKYKSELIEELYEEQIIVEDDALSTSMETCQTIPIGFCAIGSTETPDNLIDYYKITLETPGILHLALSSSSLFLKGDIMSLSFTLLNKDGTIAYQSTLYKDDDEDMDEYAMWIIDTELPAGDYYLEVKLDSNYKDGTNSYFVFYSED
ncbi:trypsin-like peptidase domain-containing protein [Lachnoclostridium sp.]|uniref:trypsin-like peptidase domain-containing protein n=1 Tax=Lachnoclostridium sp. TaxID=2028282 RepID=UPI0028A0EDAF|nr:trypsin-like peptidase domain-containing protein [Lachnoclostridium sp.]